MILTAKELLEKAKSVIDTEDKWTQGANGRRDDNTPTLTRLASKRSALGALAFAWQESNGTYSIWDSAFAALRDAAGGPTEKYNDTHTHSEVMAVYDEAIRRVS